MGEAGNREKGKGYFARRIWHGPDETCWHVWLEAPPTHQFRKGRGATVTFVQLHGTGTQQIDTRRLLEEVRSGSGVPELNKG